jgi:hypothetical protein
MAQPPPEKMPPTRPKPPRLVVVLAVAVAGRVMVVRV